jgi:hypothetical protein
MLTAIAQRLNNINSERTFERKTKLIEVCSAAYPDIRPWQVKKQCVLQPVTKNATEILRMAQLYYTYLSLLLHPSDGNDYARRDPKLVEVSLISICKSVYNNV